MFFVCLFNSERKAAFDLLSTFIQNEKLQMNNQKNEGIIIALNSLERYNLNPCNRLNMTRYKIKQVLILFIYKWTAFLRKRTPSSLEPLRLNSLTDHLKVISLDKKDLGKTVLPDPRKAQGTKMWHHLPVYTLGNIQNKSSMFIQPGKGYDRHFTIHPEWGLHAPLAMVPSQ